MNPNLQYPNRLRTANTCGTYLETNNCILPTTSWPPDQPTLGTPGRLLPMNPHQVSPLRGQRGGLKLQHLCSTGCSTGCSTYGYCHHVSRHIPPTSLIPRVGQLTHYCDKHCIGALEELASECLYGWLSLSHVSLL
jgi:hypothetical protein